MRAFGADASSRACPMKYLITADLHYALKQYDWLLRVAPEFDVVIIAGDLLDMASYVDGRTQTVVVLKYLERLSKVTRLFACSGNHDLDSHNAEGERVAKWFAKVRRLGIAADGDSFEMEDVLFTICPWWDGPSTRQAVGEQLARDASKREGKKWAWVYHAPPSGSPTSWAGERYFGDDALDAWIKTYEPDFVFSGHVHSSPFAKGGSWVDHIGPTWIFNAGFELAPTPPHMILNTDENAVIWQSSTFAQGTRLDVPLTRPVPALSELPGWA
jgi:Icc-related predicted phosphoesterase